MYPLTAINSLMSGTHDALLNVSQMSKGKSAKLTCAEGQVSNRVWFWFFLPLVPSSKICKDNYSIKYACQRQASLPVWTVNSDSGELYIASSFATIWYAEHVTFLGKGREHTVPVTAHTYSNPTAALGTAQPHLSWIWAVWGSDNNLLFWQFLVYYIFLNTGNSKMILKLSFICTKRFDLLITQSHQWNCVHREKALPCLNGTWEGKGT